MEIAKGPGDAMTKVEDTLKRRIWVIRGRLGSITSRTSGNVTRDCGGHARSPAATGTNTSQGSGVVQEAIEQEMGWATAELVEIEGYPELSFELDVDFLGLSLSCLCKLQEEPPLTPSQLMSKVLMKVSEPVIVNNLRELNFDGERVTLTAEGVQYSLQSWKVQV